MAQRTFKFRVWNKTYKEMFYTKGPNKNGEYEEKIYLQLDGVLMGDFKFTGLVDCSENYVVQQFTGLKDSKGVDVYEGDIVKFTEPMWVHPTDPNDKQKLYWDYRTKDLKQIRYGFEFGDFPHAGFVAISLDPTDLECGSPLKRIDGQYMEVVGNIFEK